MLEKQSPKLHKTRCEVLPKPVKFYGEKGSKLHKNSKLHRGLCEVIFHCCSMKNALTSQLNTPPDTPKKVSSKEDIFNEKMGIYIPPCEVVKFWIADSERQPAAPKTRLCFPVQNGVLLSTRHIHRAVFQGKIGHYSRYLSTFVSTFGLSRPRQKLAVLAGKESFSAQFLR